MSLYERWNRRRRWCSASRRCKSRFHAYRGPRGPHDTSAFSGFFSASPALSASFTRQFGTTSLLNLPRWSTANAVLQSSWTSSSLAFLPSAVGPMRIGTAFCAQPRWALLPMCHGCRVGSWYAGPPSHG